MTPFSLTQSVCVIYAGSIIADRKQRTREQRKFETFEDAGSKMAKSRSKRGENWAEGRPSCRRNRPVVLPLLESAKAPTTCQSLYWREGFQSISKNVISSRKHRAHPFHTTNESRISLLHADAPPLWANVSGKQRSTIGPNTGFHCFYVSQLIPKACFCLQGFA